MSKKEKETAKPAKKRVLRRTHSAIGNLTIVVDSWLESKAGEAVLEKLRADMEFSSKYSEILEDVQEFSKDGEAPEETLKRLRHEKIDIMNRYLDI
jgi:hypothetical protein